MAYYVSGDSSELGSSSHGNAPSKSGPDEVMSYAIIRKEPVLPHEPPTHYWVPVEKLEKSMTFGEEEPDDNSSEDPAVFVNGEKTFIL